LKNQITCLLAVEKIPVRTHVTKNGATALRTKFNGRKKTDGGIRRYKKVSRKPGKTKRGKVCCLGANREDNYSVQNKSHDLGAPYIRKTLEGGGNANQGSFGSAGVIAVKGVATGGVGYNNLGWVF